MNSDKIRAQRFLDKIEKHHDEAVEHHRHAAAMKPGSDAETSAIEEAVKSEARMKVAINSLRAIVGRMT